MRGLTITISFIYTFGTVLASSTKISNRLDQAKHLYDQIETNEYTEIIVAKKDRDDLYDRMLSRDYITNKIYTEPLVRKVKRTGWGECSLERQAISGRNNDISNLEKFYRAKRLAWPRKGFLATRFSKGIAVIEFYQCEILKF